MEYILNLRIPWKCIILVLINHSGLVSVTLEHIIDNGSIELGRRSGWLFSTILSLDFTQTTVHLVWH